MNKNMVGLQWNHERHMEINIKLYLMQVKLLLALIQPIFKLGFIPCKTEQPLKGMKLQEKETQKY